MCTLLVTFNQQQSPSSHSKVAGKRRREGEGGGERERWQDPGLGHGADGSAGTAARAAGTLAREDDGKAFACLCTLFHSFVEN